MASAGGVLVAVTVAALALRPVGLDSGPPDDSRSSLYLAAAAAAFSLYLAGLAVMRRPAAGLAVVCTLAAAIQLAPLAGPVFLSRDVYSYWAYGRISAVHGADPYVVAPGAFPADPATRSVATGWRHEPDVYGPAFAALSDGLARVTGTSAQTAALAYRALAAAAMLALVALAAARAGPFAAAFVGWNPLLALQFAGGGHNDALMMALVTAAVVLAARRRGYAGGVAWAAAVAVKWIPLALFPLQLLAERRHGRARAAVLAAATAAGAVVLLACAWLGTSWLGAFGPLAHQAHTETRQSIVRRLGLRLAPVSRSPPRSSPGVTRCSSGAPSAAGRGSPSRVACSS